LQVSRYIGAMPFVWLSVPGRADRVFLERNSSASLSRLTGCPDTPSPGWLGHDAAPAEIRAQACGTSTTSTSNMTTRSCN
jgi:hypothetical protein